MKKILVVDDDTGVLNVLRLMLEDAGYEVALAENGGEGILKAKADPPDLIISDILMPIMDGFIFYKALRKDKKTASIPILILTARGQMEDSFRAIDGEH